MVEENLLLDPVVQVHPPSSPVICSMPNNYSLPEDNMLNVSEQNLHSHEEDFPLDEDDIMNELHPQVIRPQGRHSLGRMNVVCQNCGALHWMGEKLVHSSMRNPKFGTCCKQGIIRLPPLLDPPLMLQSLFDGNNDLSRLFLNHILEYNAANAFTSLGSTMEPRVLRGRGLYNFTIHGELRHRTGALLPEENTEAVYAQLYIYDSISALDSRQRRNPRLDAEVLRIIQQILLQHNAFVHIYRHAHEILNHANVEGRNVPAYLHYSSNKDRRRYNLPSAEEIVVILPGDGTELSWTRDIIVHLKGDMGLRQINECHPAYLSLHYVLLFPYGELGWEPCLTQWDTTTNAPHHKDRITQMQYYSFRLFQRLIEYSTILRAGKLLQEFLVDAWAATEQNRLRYCRFHQQDFRVELYKDLAKLDDESRADQIGQRFVLPSSFTGGPRQMFEIYQDSMAITRHFRHPDIFLTMIANPKWPEIIAELLPNQTPNDRAELIARVFELKRKYLMREVKNKRIFGEVVAHVFTIEFQKRGLPHMHVLFFLDEPDKIRTSDQVDMVVSAEFPDPDTSPALLEIIKSCMVHGPCDTRNQTRTSLCLENGTCTKNYPKPFVETTSLDRDGYPIYRRRKDGKVYNVRGYDLDNRDVVPYNPYLSEMFGCHINVEVCAGIRCVKYIHKYIYKGHDRTTMVIGKGNEIQQYLDARYIGPPEAAWRIFGHVLHEEYPTVVRLSLHLPGQHKVKYDPTESAEAIRARAEEETSKLIAFFYCCVDDEQARAFTYVQFPEHYTWQPEGIWTP